MTRYEKSVVLWQQKKITTDEEISEAMNGHSIAFAYHSGRIENELVTFNDTREIFEHDGETFIPAIFALCLRSATQRKRTNFCCYPLTKIAGWMKRLYKNFSDA